MMKFKWSVSRSDRHGSEVTGGKATWRQLQLQRDKRLPLDSASWSHMCSKHRGTCLWRRPYKEHFVSAAVPLPKQTLSMVECAVWTERRATSRTLLLPRPASVHTWRHTDFATLSSRSGQQLTGIHCGLLRLFSIRRTMTYKVLAQPAILCESKQLGHKESKTM